MPVSVYESVPHLMPISVCEKGHESCVYLTWCLFQCLKRAMRVVCTSLNAYFIVLKGPWELCITHLMPVSVCEKGHESCVYLTWCLFQCVKRAMRVVCTSLDAYFSVWKGPWELCVPHLMPVSVSEKGHESRMGSLPTELQGQHSFITECFHLTQRALSVTVIPAIKHYNKMHRWVKHVLCIICKTLILSF